MDLTFLIPTRIETEDRLRNIISSVSYLLKHLDAKVIVKEVAPHHTFLHRALPEIKKYADTSNLTCLFEVPGLPYGRGDYRFFEPGNHFSKNIYIQYVNEYEVDAHLPMFEKYLQAYIDMLEATKPTGTDTSAYKDFDAYMTKLDPVGGFLAGKFGKEKADSLVNDFLFSYA